MSGSHLCIPRNKTVISRTELQYYVLSPSTYTHNLWEIYIFPGSVCLFCRSEICGLILGIYKSQTHECGNWDWGRAIPRKGIHKWDFPCSLVTGISNAGINIKLWIYCTVSANFKEENVDLYTSTFYISRLTCLKLLSATYRLHEKIVFL